MAGFADGITDFGSPTEPLAARLQRYRRFPVPMDDSGSAPVVGDVVLAGLAVLFAILVAVLVLELSAIVAEPSPVAEFETDYSSDVDPTTTDSFGRNNTDGRYDGILTFTHAEGRIMSAQQLRIGGPASIDGQRAWGDAVDPAAISDDGTVEAGRQLRVWVRAGETVYLTWHDPDSDRSALLVRWTGPGT